MAGVLRYNRESDNHSLDGRTINHMPQTMTSMSSVIICEFCGKKARPSLDLMWVEEPEKPTQFCCPQHQQLCELLVHQMHLAQEKSDLRTDIPIQEDTQTPSEQEQLLCKKREIMECRKQEQDRLYRDNTAHPPFVETWSKTLSYQLSTCAPGNGRWTLTPPKTDKSHEIKKQEAEMMMCCCDHKQFGISYHQGGGAECLQKYYNHGLKFLTVFPDGSAQVFYPSGLLAVVIVVTEGKGRVCIVYEDSPEQQIRAVFLSDGRATCYYSHGSIWLSLDSSGGQCLDGLGARIQHWSWNILSATPTPLRPVILSLNKCIGVRVLGPQQVFISFLACSQQAKFRVGACCVQVECKGSIPAPGSSLTKEELFVLAGRIRAHLTIKHLHQCLRTPSDLRPLRARLSPHLIAVVQRLLEVSKMVQMSKRESDFIHSCLQDCLM